MNSHAGVKPQRIRDPLHDLITFDVEEFERVMWQVVQTEPFQRLRRVRQLGFSEFTYPGATHTRFAHSVGVFHTARKLMDVIKSKVPKEQFSDTKSRTALAAALLHDVGHGMFSHAFESVADELELSMASHEVISDQLIRNSEISDLLPQAGVQPKDVATLISRKGPVDIYDAVVSSQFDADRLDYMMRDRLMSGVQSGGIDFTWLIENLEIGEVSSVQGEASGNGGAEPDKVLTFVLGAKAIMAAEAYVLALFQLYPSIYFHKATRSAEVVFKALMKRVFGALKDGDRKSTGLPAKHPFVNLAKRPGDVATTLGLDDTVLWGSLHFFDACPDNGMGTLAKSLRHRNLPKAEDVGKVIYDLYETKLKDASAEEREKIWVRVAAKMNERVDEWNERHSSEGHPRILLDDYSRTAYSTSSKKGQLNQIHVKKPDGEPTDIRELSPMIASLEDFRFIRAYTFRDDKQARTFAKSAAAEVIKQESENG